MPPKKSRADIERKSFEAITAINAKLETFIKQHPNFTDEKISAFVEQCEEEKSQITDKYNADVAESDDPTPTAFTHAERNEDNLGNYD